MVSKADFFLVAQSHPWNSINWQIDYLVEILVFSKPSIWQSMFAENTTQADSAILIKFGRNSNLKFWQSMFAENITQVDSAILIKFGRNSNLKY